MQYSFYTAEYQEGCQVVQGEKECSVFFNFLKQVLFLENDGEMKSLFVQDTSHSKHALLISMNRKEISDMFFFQHVLSGVQEENSFLSDKYTSGYYTVGLRKLVI